MIQFNKLEQKVDGPDETIYIPAMDRSFAIIHVHARRAIYTDDETSITSSPATVRA